MADKEEAQKDDQKADPKQGGGKKLLIVGLMLGLLIGAGGVAGFFMTKSSAPEAVVVEEVVEELPELPDYQYARMEKLKLPLFYEGRVLNYTVMDVSMEVIGNDNKMRLVKNVIIIRDALLRYFSVNSVGREDNPRIVDYDKLSEKIMEFANKEMHGDIVTRVAVSESRSF